MVGPRPCGFRRRVKGPLDTAVSISLVRSGKAVVHCADVRMRLLRRAGDSSGLFFELKLELELELGAECGW